MRVNDPILIDYPVRIRLVLLSILIILPILFYFKPRFLGEVGVQEEEENVIIETIDVPPPKDVVQQKPSRPAIPEPVDDDTDDEEIEEFQDTDFSNYNNDFKEESRASKFIAFDENPVAVSGIKLKYPAMAKAAGIEGTVVLEFFINKEGVVTDVDIINGTGTVLDQAAISAVRASTWKPARQRTKKVGIWMKQSLKFNLNN